MRLISNIRFGRKIGIVLGGISAVTTVMSGIALWSNGANAQTAKILNQRLTKARLAERVAGDTAAISSAIARMIIAKQTSPDLISDMGARKKDRLATLQEFRILADTPQSIRSGEEMAELVQTVSQASAEIVKLLQAGQTADAVGRFDAARQLWSSLETVSGEASRFQRDRAVVAESDQKERSETVWIVLIAGSLLTLGCAVAGGIVLTRGIATPLATAVAHLGEIAKGDLSQDAPAAFLAREDEVGMLARAKQSMIASLRGMVREIGEGIYSLSSSSSELVTSSTQMTAGSRHASDKAHSVSAAAEEMSSNIMSVAAGMEETTTNLANVAAATEQMTSTIGEIAGNSEKARLITAEATMQAGRITAQITQLGHAAR